MRFLNAEFLWHLLWIVPLFSFLAIWAWRKRAGLLTRLFGGDPDGHVVVSKTARVARLAFLLAALACLAVAAARPAWGVQILPSGGSGRDLLVLFDVSKSMLCKDVQPSRLEHGKWFVRELVKRSHGDRFGLVAFAGTAFLECPLTSDKTSFLQALGELDVDSVPVGGTNLQNALDTAFKAFQAAEGGHRAIVLVTDGDELDGDCLKAVERAKETKTPLFIVGVGDPSQPSIIQAPDENGKFSTLKDSSGEVVKSHLNEKVLGELALKSGGIYVRSTSANTGLAEIEGRVASLVPKDYELGKQTRPIERFAYPLAFAFGFFLLWLCVSERGVRRAVALFALIAALSVPGSANAGDEKPGSDSVDAVAPASPASPEKAASGKEAVKAPSSALDSFNKAVDLQSAGKDAQEAAKLYSEAIAKEPADKELVSRACQNLGVIAHGQARELATKKAQEDLKAQNLDEAGKSVDSALKAYEGAEELYREGLRSPSDSLQGLKSNQQTLLLDREAAEKLKQRIEQLKKQLEQAQKDLKQAQQDQKNQDQKNQQQNQQQQQQSQKNQDQKNQQQQGQQSQKNQDQQQGQQQNQQQQNQQQGQQSQQNQQQQQSQQQQGQQQNQQQGSQGQQGRQDGQKDSAKDSAQEAKDAVSQLKDMASSLGQSKMEKSAEKSESEIEKAMDAQSKGDGKEAEKRLEQAMKALEQAQKDASGGKDEKKDKRQSGDKGKDEKSKQDQASQQQQQGQDGQQDRKLDKSQGRKMQKSQADARDDKEIAPEQAESVLNSMANDEKSLRDVIKKNQREAYGMPRVDKDW